MIGKVNNEIGIDYTGVSTPLTVEDVYRDLQEITMNFNDDPVKFRMWEHQWDYILKRADVDDENYSYVYDGNDRWLWGIRVELAAAPVAAPQIESRPEMTDEEYDRWVRENYPNLRVSYVDNLRAEQDAILKRAKKES